VTPGVDGDAKRGEMSTAVSWELPLEGVSGDMEIASTYEAGDNMSMRLALVAHRSAQGNVI
jgi:hypothetical protein